MLVLEVKNFSLDNSINSGEFFRYEKEKDNIEDVCPGQEYCEDFN